MRSNLKLADTTDLVISEDELRLLEEAYCSHGDTVHYSQRPKFFESCDGSFVYDATETPFLDLQMWYSAVNFGYRNERLNNVAHRQLDRLPQIASQYLHREKVELAAMIAKDAEQKFGTKGRVHFNVGGSQAVEDSLKIVRNYSEGKSLMFAFEGGYHGRTLGATSITSSYRYRRRYGHFGERAQFIEFPYHFRGPKGMSKEEYGHYCVQKFARLFESEYNGVWDPKAGKSEYAAFYVEPIQGTGGYVIPPMNFFIELKKVLDDHGILLVVDEIQMGVYRTGKLWSIEHFGVSPDVLVFGKAITNGLNPLSGIWAKEEMINPTIFPPGSTHSTFASNPMGTSVALETLKMVSENDFGASVMVKGAHFLEGLKDLQSQHAIIGDVDGLGLALRMEICKPDGFTPDKATLDWMSDEGMKGDLVVDGKKYGLVLDVGGYHKNVITLAPNLMISHEEIELAVSLLGQLLARAERR
ncbi:aspartate aminotransferase family protein [Rhizobium leguminosarum]|uniref:Aminotransferase class III-fold pyridoxal phosphate-dependent enzyme n=1 Tax=Rhizobium leguminosarum TaxID=384 RepID=A0ABD7PK48_RHILE|nr:aminotransferase class III-fold pyridoxal phosphate-dependent enzyme [Rhizobium leguminosarum]TAV64742.1 aminotransferase class III-fold pyridoxal phosphate-dependent enzyme [Rhizobium leguminosarum]TAV65200.1 aminotransferase class III-fold pyridoxal phosphate-dependent enzyme [Rhizobium leguminosarum]TAW25189.1 aminotransferase class III-fold pyridoxal phosphate-dependent enzyme [Rhizobium leguminosarum]TAW38960.1 aminotransferase class III-fold pyridoxal phosphate-dependent enzyme [Rhizob